MIIMELRLGLVVLLVSVDVLRKPPLPCLPTVTQQLDICFVLNISLI